MGEIGGSFAHSFKYRSAQEVIDFLNTKGANTTIQTEDGTYGVLTGDQVLFEGNSISECTDFLYGLLLGGTLFSNLATEADRPRRK